MDLGWVCEGAAWSDFARKKYVTQVLSRLRVPIPLAREGVALPEPHAHQGLRCLSKSGHLAKVLVFHSANVSSNQS
jgi:hypothetical protein